MFSFAAAMAAFHNKENQCEDLFIQLREMN